MKPGKDSSKSPRPASLSVSSVRSLGNFENRINALLKYNDGQPWFDASGNRPTPADVYNISVKLETTTGNLEWCLIPARQLGATIFPDKSLVLQFYIACPFSSNNTIYIKVSFDVNAQRVKVTLGIDYDLNPGVNSRIYLEGIASDAGPIPGLVSDWIQDPDSTYRLKLLLDGGKTRIALFPKDAKPKDPLDPNLPCQQYLRDDKSGRHSFQIDAMLPFTTWSKEWNDRVNAIVVGPMEALSPPAAFSFTPIFDGVKKSISSVTSFSLIDNGSQSTPYKIRLQSLIVAPGQELTVTFPRLLASKPHLLPLHGILVTTDPTTNLPVRSPSAGTPEPPPTVQVRGAVKLDNRNSDWFSLGSLTFCPPNPSQPGDCFFGYYTGAQDDNKGHFRHRSGVFALSQVSVASAQLDPLREVEETLLLIAEPLQGAFELAYDEERVGYGEPHSVTLNLKHAPTPSGQLPSIPASIIALSASPLLVARITYQVANSDAASRIIANWSTDIIGSDWSWKSDPAQPVITLSLPPQTVDEKIHVIRGDYEPEDYLAFSFCRRADFNLTWLDTASQFGTAPWALGELLGYSGQRSPGARLISLASEFMAGVSIDATPRQMRLLELSALLGRCAPVNRAENSFAVYWRKLGKRYNSRPAVLIPQREFESALTTSLTAAADNLRFTLKVTDSDLTGSLQHLIDSSNIRDLLVSRPVSELARLDGARHTSLGGSGRGDGVFAGNSTVSMTMGMGRLEKLVVTREGRIGIFGHRARHVVIGARALVPTEQFVDYQDPLLGQAMVRKTEEYVEIEPLKQYGTLDKLSLGPVQAVEFGTTRGNFVRIPVDSRWGSDFTLANAGKPIKGWKIPLWQRGLKPTVYPRPALHFHLAKAESSAAFPVENVELVHFYTLTDGVNDSIDTWPQLPGIDGLTPDKALAETALPGIDDHPVPDSYHEPFTFFFLGGTEPVNLLHGRSDEIVSTELQSITVACNVDPLKANPFTLQSRFPRASQVSSSPAFDLRKNARRALASLAATSHTLAFLRIDSAVAMRIAAAAPGPADFLLDACVSAAQQQQGAWSPPLLADSSKVPQIILKLRKKNEFQKDRFLKQAVEYYRLLAKATDPLNKVKKQTLRQAKQALERLSVEYDHLARHFPYCKSQALKLARTAYLNCVQKYADAAYAVTQGSRLQDTLNALIHELQGLEKSLSANWVPFLWGHPDRYYFENFLVESIAIRRDLFALAGTSSAGMEDTLKKILGLEKVTLDGLQSLILAYRAADSTPFQQKTAILAALEKAYDDAETAVEDGTVFSPPSENDIAASYDNPTDSPNVLQAQEIQKLCGKVTATSVDDLKKALGLIPQLRSLTVALDPDDVLSWAANTLLTLPFYDDPPSFGDIAVPSADLTLWRGFGSTPSLPSLDLQQIERPVMGFHFVFPTPNLTLSILPNIAFASRGLSLGQFGLGGGLPDFPSIPLPFGFQFPTTGLGDRFLPQLPSMDVSSLIPRLGGLDLKSIFRSSLADTGNIKVRHGYDSATKNAWVAADILSLQSNSESFINGLLTISGGKFKAEAKSTFSLANKRSSFIGTGDFHADWAIAVGGKPMVTVKQLGLIMDTDGHFSVDFNPANLQFDDAVALMMKALGNSGPTPPFNLKVSPLGVLARINLAFPELSSPGLTIRNLGFSCGIDINFAPRFEVVVSAALASEQAPATIAFGIYGGAVFLESSVALPSMTSVSKFGIFALATFGLHLGPLTGSISAYIGAIFTIRVGGGAGPTEGKVIFRISGQVQVGCIARASVDIELDIIKSGDQVYGLGTISVSIRICWCFTFSFNHEYRKAISGSSSALYQQTRLRLMARDRVLSTEAKRYIAMFKPITVV